jgi:hypothetical protein
VPNCLQLINKYWHKKFLERQKWAACFMDLMWNALQVALSVTIRYCLPLTLKDGWYKRETSINRWKYDRPLRTFLNNDLIWLLQVSHNTCMLLDGPANQRRSKQKESIIPFVSLQ